MNLDQKQAAKYLCVSISKLYKLTHGRQIRYHKLGSKNVFRIDDLEDYIQKNRRPSIDEIRAGAIDRMQSMNAHLV